VPAITLDNRYSMVYYGLIFLSIIGSDLMFAFPDLSLVIVALG